ncbi:MAG: hypothetical protein ACOH1Y_16340 [Propionicimonas sp.]
MAEESQRQTDARRRHELAAAGAQAEARAAHEQLDAFVARMRELGVAPEPLQATLLNGSRVKTDKAGWYLNKARTLAVADDGTYYQLVTAGSGLARFTGLKLQPSAPTLVIGRGGRDGETGDLADFLARAHASYAGN